MDWRVLLRHHPPHEAGERCLVLPGGLQLCRRCTWLYPASLLAMGVQLATGLVPEALHFWLLVLLPLPTTAIFVLEQVGLMRYRPLWVALGSLLLAPALGVGLARYLRNPIDPMFWGMVTLFATPALAAVIYHRTR